MAEDTPATKLIPVLGEDGVKRLEDSCVLVFGAGGVGSNCVESLARARVGKFVLVDADVVSLSNINRQAIAFMSTQGRPKVEVMAEMIHDINPDAEVICRQVRVTAEGAADLLDELLEAAGRIDHVVDAVDTISVKLELAALAEERGFALISSMGGANKLHPECLRITDISKTVNCRLSRVMRKECRRRGIRRLTVLYSCEHARPATGLPGRDRSERSGMGTVSYMPPIMGQMIAGYLIRKLTGVGVEAVGPVPPVGATR